MNAEIIAVGSELLLGQIANTNAQFISQQLAETGIDVYRHRVVGDNAARLMSELKEAENRADIVILTGGLGPTKDDLTKETIASFTDRELIMHKESLDAIEHYFLESKRTMTDNNRKQALVLDQSEVFINKHGMAPGMLFTHNNTVYVLLPGPPREMRPMFQHDVIPKLVSFFSEAHPVRSRVLRYFGIGEAELETRIESILDRQQNPTIAPLASDGEVTLRLTAKHENKDIALSMLNEAENEINAIVGEYMYGKDEESLIQKVYSLLHSLQLTIACAESLTAGMFASQLASISGASAILDGGVVCYSDKVKEQVVGVDTETLAAYGSVSKETAIELAVKVRQLLQSDIGISFTGVADKNPVEGNPSGAVWIGIACGEKEPYAIPLSLQGERNYIRIRAVKHGLFQIIRLLQDKTSSN